MPTNPDSPAANRQELCDLLVELAQWSGVAEKNGDLHARIASALALESSAADESVGERQGRQPAQDFGQDDAESVIPSIWEKADPLSDPTSGQGANAKPGLSDHPGSSAASGCNCSSAVSLRRELVTIFGPVKPREGETWNAAMLRRITERLVEANV